MIFIKVKSLNSLVTGPNILVPNGSSLLSSRTTALLSNLISDPSGLLTPFFVLTITALYTSPFFTLALGIASLTATLITSPTDANLL